MTSDRDRRPDPEGSTGRDDHARSGSDTPDESFIPPDSLSEDVEILDIEAVDELGRPLDDAAGERNVDEPPDGGSDQEDSFGIELAVVPVEMDDHDDDLVQNSELRQELDELQERHTRLLADFDNYRRRRDREADEARGRGVGDLAADLLALVDNLERALEAVPAGTPKTVEEGIGLILRQAMDLLRKHGIEPVDALGETFDPRYHEAMDVVERTDFEDQRVIEEVQKGYVHHGRLLRPSLVRVVRNPETQTREDGAE